jgi:hypothetical protein
MSVRKSYIHEPGFWFITITCSDFLPLIEIVNGYDLVYNWFDHLRLQGQDIAGYVIMPNHLHLIMAYRVGNHSLNTVVANGKRFMAYEIVKRLKALQKAGILQKLEGLRTTSEIAAKKQHRVFEISFDAQKCFSNKFLNQKLTYIHNNPCNKKWMLAPDTLSYPHSSAYFYETGKQGIYEIKNVLELEGNSWII